MPCATTEPQRGERALRVATANLCTLNPKGEASASYAMEAASASGRAMLVEMHMRNEPIDYTGVHEDKPRAQSASTILHYRLCEEGAAARGTTGCQAWVHEAKGFVLESASCCSPRLVVVRGIDKEYGGAVIISARAPREEAEPAAEDVVQDALAAATLAEARRPSVALCAAYRCQRESRPGAPEGGGPIRCRVRQRQRRAVCAAVALRRALCVFDCLRHRAHVALAESNNVGSCRLHRPYLSCNTVTVS